MAGPRQIAKRPMGEVVPFKPEATTPLYGDASSTLSFTWDALERQLVDLAVTPMQQGLAPTLVSGTRKQAMFKPPERVLREILCIASVLMDETFYTPPSPPQSKEGEMT